MAPLLSVTEPFNSRSAADKLALIKLINDFLFDESRDEITINGNKSLINEVTLKTARDHRMVMTAYLFLRANNGGFLAESDCVEKSFSDFFLIMKD